MNAATIKRPRAAAAQTNPGDHRASAVAVVRTICDRAATVWGGANGMTEHAWELLNTATFLGEQLVERNEPTVTDHAGGLKCYIESVRAAFQGVRALIEDTNEDDRTPDDLAALLLVAKSDPKLVAALEGLERQRHWEVDLGNKPTGAPAATAAATARAEVDENPHFLMGQAIAVFQSAAQEDDTADAIYALRNLAMFCDERVSQALADLHPSSYEDASAALASLLDLMAILPAEKAGDKLFYAAQSLLQLAKTEIDAQWHALEQAEREAAHA
jgi:hypothetical protein